MERWKNVPLSEEEKEGITVNGEVELGDEIFHKMLVGNLWTDNPFNIRALKSIIIQVWWLKNNVEAQYLGKNLFLFNFSSKRDAEIVINDRP